jgi:phage portal protein BeeE
MDALNSEVVDLRFLCNVFGGVPSQLLNDSAVSTYNNVAEGEKALTTRCAAPLLTSRERSFNRKLQMMPAYAGKNIIGEFDRTVYTELEEDKVALTAWLKDSFLPIRRRYELLNEDIPESLTEEELNAIPIPTGTTLLSELFVQPTSIQADVNTLDAAGANPYNTNA